jgi:hypothetical protein
MSHRGLCKYCGKVIWMGQPAAAVYDMRDLVHSHCAETMMQQAYIEGMKNQSAYEHEMAMYALYASGGHY